jgi:hypothetical protein
MMWIGVRSGTLRLWAPRTRLRMRTFLPCGDLRAQLSPPAQHTRNFHVCKACAINVLIPASTTFGAIRVRLNPLFTV